MGRLVGMACFLDQPRGDDAVDDTKHPAHDLGPAGEQETQWKGKAEYPLAHGLFGQHLVDPQRRAFGYTPCTATGAEAATFAAECNHMLGVTGLAAHPQKPVIETAALQVVLELEVHVIRQFPALLRPMVSKRRAVCFDDPIAQGLLGTVALESQCRMPASSGHAHSIVAGAPQDCRLGDP